MAVYWTTMVYEILGAETSVRHVISHDADAELAFKVSVVPIGADVRISAVREEREDSIHTIFPHHSRYFFRRPGYPLLGVMQSCGCIRFWLFVSSHFPSPYLSVSPE